MNEQILPRKFYNQETAIVARELLGKYLIRKIGKKKLIAEIIETEAYVGPEDAASHSRFGETGRNKVMFGPAGHAYVYLIYGTYHCLNISTREVGFGAAVLLRAARPVKNITQKMSGPGLLCLALNIDRSLNGTDMTKRDGLYILNNGEKNNNKEVFIGPRVGIAYAGEWRDKPLRFRLNV